MPKFKVKSFPPVRVDNPLYEQAVKYAGIADEVLSVFIRKAVKMRIKQMQDEKLPEKAVTVVDTPAIRNFPKGGK